MPYTRQRARGIIIYKYLNLKRKIRSQRMRTEYLENLILDITCQDIL